jgi:DUF1009 family protein
MQIGIIAGQGELPIIIASDAKKRGYTVITVAIENLADPAIEKVSDDTRWVNVGKLGDLIETFSKSGIKQAVMAGKVPKSILYKTKVIPDMRAVKLLFSLKDRSDDTIMNALTSELEKEGISIIDTVSFSPDILTPEGSITKTTPSKDEWKDIEFGWRIAKEIGRLDIGQTVVIKGKAVMAIEAIEGTDEAIARGGKLAGEGAVVVKVSKPQQDMRLDVPVAGSDTISAMSKAGARVLALEAGRSIIINRQKVAAEANAASIAIVGIKL